MSSNTKTKDSLLILLIYILIGISGLLTFQYFQSNKHSEVASFLYADIVMTIVCFTGSLIKKNSSVYDAYWSVIPFYFLVLWAYLYSDSWNIYHTLMGGSLSFWSWRLTLNWLRSWTGFEHEDWRYIDLRNQTGAFYPFVNLGGIHFFPTFMVFANMWPLFYLFGEGVEMNNAIFIIGLLISVVGTLFEFFADNTLAQFRRRANPIKGEILEEGLWGRCRYPNYLGEILFWVGIGLMGVAGNAPWYTLSGVLALMAMFLFISIPMKEKRMLERRTNFEAYQARVPLLIPKFRK